MKQLGTNRIQSTSEVQKPSRRMTWWLVQASCCSYAYSILSWDQLWSNLWMFGLCFVDTITLRRRFRSWRSWTIQTFASSTSPSKIIETCIAMQENHEGYWVVQQQDVNSCKLLWELQIILGVVVAWTLFVSKNLRGFLRLHLFGVGALHRWWVVWPDHWVWPLNREAGRSSWGADDISASTGDSSYPVAKWEGRYERCWTPQSILNIKTLTCMKFG